jgi:hypothetical protein
VERAALHRLVDQLNEAAVLGVGRVGLARGDGGLEAAEVGLDRRGVPAILVPLALSAKNALFL